MKIVLVSDTHGLHNSIMVPNGDLLIHAGDLSASGTDSEVAAAAKWLGSLPHRHKIVIAGNHDWLFERQPTRAAALLRSAGVTYLQDSGTSVDGLSIYGAPWQPEFMHWAFNVPRGQLARYWKQIPTGPDILITHGPPYGILDQRIQPGVRRLAPWEEEEPFSGSDHVGDEELLAAVQRARPRIHVFGHIHSGYGRTENMHTTFYNAAMCNEDYEPVNDPWVIDVVPRK
jgi:calcineurin-like phosphoesterase family protein